MVMAELRIRPHVVRWLRWYLSGVSLAGYLTGLEPNSQPAGRWIQRAIRVEVIRRPWRASVSAVRGGKGSPGVASWRGCVRAPGPCREGGGG